MILRETTGSSSLSESQESLVVSISLMSPHWSALVSVYAEVPLVSWVSSSLSVSWVPIGLSSLWI